MDKHPQEKQPRTVPIFGTVYGTLLNTKAEIASLGPALSAAPYNAPPKAPILYIKPPGTWRLTDGTVRLPRGADTVEVSATMGVVIGRPATRVAEASAFDHVAGYIAAIDICLPHKDYYRPSVKERCRDGFLPIASRMTARENLPDPNHIAVRTLVNGEEKGCFSTLELVRPIAKLMADVTDFMTLYEGDVLLVGLTPERPLAHSGDIVTASVTGMDTVEVQIGSAK